jgi:hypothetical protein
MPPMLPLGKKPKEKEKEVASIVAFFKKPPSGSPADLSEGTTKENGNNKGPEGELIVNSYIVVDEDVIEQAPPVLGKRKGEEAAGSHADEPAASETKKKTLPLHPLFRSRPSVAGVVVAQKINDPTSVAKVPAPAADTKNNRGSRSDSRAEDVLFTNGAVGNSQAHHTMLGEAPDVLIVESLNETAARPRRQAVVTGLQKQQQQRLDTASLNKVLRIGQYPN